LFRLFKVHSKDLVIPSLPVKHFPSLSSLLSGIPIPAWLIKALTRETAVTLKQNKMETTVENLTDAFKEWMGQFIGKAYWKPCKNH